MVERHEESSGLSRRGVLGAAAAAAAAAAVLPAGAADAAARPGGDAGGRRVPTGLMTSLQDDALGVSSSTPRLTWEVPVVASGLQDGYEIQLVRDPRGFGSRTRPETTGVVRSDRSVAISWPFKPLAAREVAFWRVRVRFGSSTDHGRSGFTDWSAPTRIVRGPVEDGDWGGAQTIWAEQPAPAQPYTDATFTADLEIQRARAGVLVRTSHDLATGYMWQLNPGSQGLLRQHVIAGGAYTLLREVTLPVAIPATGVFSVKIVASGDTIETHINGELADSTSGLTSEAGAFGFRTGSSETFWADNLVVTGADGEIIYSEDFTNPASAVALGTWDNGRLLVGISTAEVLGEADDSWAFLRKEFDLPAGTIAGAYLYISAQYGSLAGYDQASVPSARQHVYRAWCNGTHVSVGPSQARDTPRYQVEDVTHAVRAGRRNALAVQCWTQSQQQMQALLDVHYADGRTVTLTSGTDWSGRSGGKTLPWAGSLKSSYYVAPAEYFDARYESVGWKQPGYRGDDFSAAVPATQLTGLIAAGTTNVTQVPRRPASVVQTSPGTWLVDVGKELTGAVRLTVDAPADLAGHTVDLQMGEERNPDGTVRYQLRCGISYHDVWTLRAGEQTIEHWGYRSFRWLQIVVDPSLDLHHAVTILQQVAPQPEQLGSFRSSNPDLDKVYDFCAYTISAARLDLYPDSPTRERCGTEGDLCVHAKSEMAVSRSYDLIRYANSQWLLNYEAYTEYWFMLAVTAWDEYIQSGDPDWLADAWDGLVTAQCVSLFNGDGLIQKPTSTPLHRDIVDWPQPAELDGFVFEQVNTVVNAWQYQSLLVMQKIATVLGKDADATKYGQYAATMRASMNRLLYDSATGAYYDGVGTTHQAQHSSLYSASLGVPDPSELPKIADWLASNSANPVRTSCNAARWLLEALIIGGRMDAALDIMTSRRDTSWLAMMEQWGATQTMEGWSPNYKSNTTFSHPWASGPAEIIPRYVLGVQTTDAGAARIEVRPQLAHLANATGTVPTVRGLVEVTAVQSPGYEVSVTTPGNTTGTLYWPAAGHGLGQFRLTAPDRSIRPRLEQDLVVVPLVPGRTELTI